MTPYDYYNRAFDAQRRAYDLMRAEQRFSNHSLAGLGQSAQMPKQDTQDNELLLLLEESE